MTNQLDFSAICDEPLVDSFQLEIQIPVHHVHVHNVTCYRIKGGASGKGSLYFNDKD